MRVTKNITGELSISGPSELIEGKTTAELVAEFKRQCLASGNQQSNPASPRLEAINEAIQAVNDSKAEWLRQLELVKGLPEAEARISTATHACHLIVDALERLKNAH